MVQVNGHEVWQKIHKGYPMSKLFLTRQTKIHLNRLLAGLINRQFNQWIYTHHHSDPYLIQIMQKSTNLSNDLLQHDKGMSIQDAKLKEWRQHLIGFLNGVRQGHHARSVAKKVDTVLIDYLLRQVVVHHVQVGAPHFLNDQFLKTTTM